MSMLSKIRQALAGAAFDALLLTGERNRRYATGFHSSAGACLITAQRAVFFTDFRYIEAARDAVHEFDVCEIGAGQSYAEAINSLLDGDEIRTIALEDLDLTHEAFLRWKKGLHAEACALSDLIEQLRVIKEPHEIACIEHAQRIAERALSELLDDIRPGTTEKQLAARLTYLMLLYGAENLSFDPIVVSGINSSKPHGVPSDKPLAAGDFVTLDFGCIYEGYCSDMTRTFAIEHCTDEMAQVYDTVLCAQRAGIRAAKAGATGCEIDGAARALIEAAGFGDAFGHGFGHSLGLYIHESPSASQSAKTPLPAGTVLTAEPGIYLPGRFGVRIEDMLLLTDTGCRNLTNAPKELTILG